MSVPLGIGAGLRRRLAAYRTGADQEVGDGVDPEPQGALCPLACARVGGPRRMRPRISASKRCAEPRRVDTQQQAVDAHHASLGLVRAYSTRWARSCTSSRSSLRPRSRQLVVAPLRFLPVGRLREHHDGLACQPGIEQTLNGGVQRARPEPHSPVASRFGLLLDRVAVPRAVRQRQQEVQDGGGQRTTKVRRAGGRDISRYDMSGPRHCQPRTAELKLRPTSGVQQVTLQSRLRRSERCSARHRATASSSLRAAPASGTRWPPRRWSPACWRAS